MSRLSLTAIAVACLLGTNAHADEPAARAKNVVPLRVRAAGNAAAAGQAVVSRRSVYGTNVPVREEADRNDSVERMLLMLPGGPLVVEMSITVEGKSFRIAREELVDEMLDFADTDGDGKATWQEAINSPRFTFARYRSLSGEQKERFLKAYDTNQNGFVERVEARKFVAQLARGDAFAVSGWTGFRGGFGGVVVLNNGRVATQAGRADVHAFLDTDKDGTLSKKEIDGAAKRLKSRDADDNDLLLPTEITNVAARQGRNRRPTALRPGALLLGPTARADALFKSLQEEYGDEQDKLTAKTFSRAASLFKTLDENENGTLEQGEVIALNTVEPDLKLAIDLPKAGDEAKGLSVTSTSGRLQTSATAKENAVFKLPGVRLAVTAALTPARSYDYSRTAKRYIELYDKNSNQYIEKEELPANFVRQFEVWDGDGDGKVYEKEITASYSRMRAPQETQVRATVSNQGNALFQTLDLSGDGRLSLREMRTASTQILIFDADEDGQVSADEIPVTFSVNVGLGTAGYYSYRRGRQGQPAARQPSAPDAPEWFTRMDRNGDGDVTLKEFLGTKAQFAGLDTNEDGFIEPKEAKAAGEAKE